MLCVYRTVLLRSTRVSISHRLYERHPGLKPLDYFSDSEGELTLCAGDYLLVWGSGEPQGGYFDAELLDGRRGLVPASYVQRLIGKYLVGYYSFSHLESCVI